MIIITAKEVAVQCIFGLACTKRNPTTLRMHNFSKCTLEPLKSKIYLAAMLTFSSTLKYSKVYHKVFQQRVFSQEFYAMCHLDPDQIYENWVRRLQYSSVF